jgi:hypothetical protein
MGSIGDCYDNGLMESFWARMQVELLNRKRWNTRLELANAIFEYLEIFHTSTAPGFVEAPVCPGFRAVSLPDRGPGCRRGGARTRSG